MTAKQVVQIADLPENKLIDAFQTGDFGEVESIERAIDTAWAEIFRAVQSGAAGIAWWTDGDALQYALHRSTKEAGYMQVSVMMLRGGEIIPLSDHQSADASDFLREVVRSTNGLAVNIA